MEAVNIRKVDINELTDLRDIAIDTKKSVAAKPAYKESLAKMPVRFISSLS